VACEIKLIDLAAHVFVAEIAHQEASESTSGSREQEGSEREDNESSDGDLVDSRKRTLEEEFELLSQGRVLGPRQKRARVLFDM
jgi:hypothetical protein